MAKVNHGIPVTAVRSELELRQCTGGLVFAQMSDDLIHFGVFRIILAVDDVHKFTQITVDQAYDIISDL